jgi:hypothetical protein
LVNTLTLRWKNEQAAPRNWNMAASKISDWKRLFFVLSFDLPSVVDLIMLIGKQDNEMEDY